MKTQISLRKFSLCLALGLVLALLAGCGPVPARPAAIDPAAGPGAVDNPVMPTPTAAPIPVVPTPLPAGDVSVSEPDAGKTIHLEKGQTLSVILEGNPSTGYTWVLVPAPQGLLVPMGEPEAIFQGSLVGSPAKIHLLLLAEAEGEQFLQLAYRRPWEADVAPLRTFSLMVVVGKPAQSQAADLSLSELDAGATIHLEKGQTLAVTLEGNPSTGYTWVLVPTPQAILVQVGEPEAASQGSLVGSPAKIRLLLQATADGTQLLQLAYRRPWEAGVAPERTFSLTVTVGKPAPAVTFPAGGLKDWQTYTNSSYGFSFLYPPEWRLQEGKGTLAGHAVLLLPPGGAAQLQVAFKRASEDVQIGRTGMGSGELFLSGKVLLVGSEVDRQVLVDNGRHMTVRYICDGCLTRAGLVFGFDLDILGVWSDPAAGLTPELETQADLVVASVKLAK